MRPPSIADLEFAARVLSCFQIDERKETARELIERATIADRHLRSSGRPHPNYGTGTLMSAAVHFKGHMPRADTSTDLILCLNVLTTELLNRTSNQMT